MTNWVNDGKSIWGVWEKAGAYGVCKFSDRWRLGRVGSRPMLDLTPQSARRAAMIQRMLQQTGGGEEMDQENYRELYGYKIFRNDDGFVIYHPGKLTLFVTAEGAKRLDLGDTRRIELLLKDAMKHAQSDSL